MAAYAFTVPFPTIAGSHSNANLVITEAKFPALSLDGPNEFDNNGGNLVVYTDSTKATRIPIFVRKFVTGGTPKVIVHILAPSLVTGGEVYCVADEVQTTQPIVTALYGRNACFAQWEFVYIDGVDVTGHYPYITVEGTLASVNDFFGEPDAYVWDTANEKIDIDTEVQITRNPQDGLTATDEITYACWATNVGTTTNQRLFTMHGTAGNGGGFSGFGFNYGGAGVKNFFIGGNIDDTTSLAYYADLADVTTARHYSGSMSFDKTTRYPLLVADGVEQSVLTQTNMQDGTFSSSFRIGTRNDNANDFVGTAADEWYGRFGSSAERLEETGKNHSAPATWWGTPSAWAEEGGGPTVVDFTGAESASTSENFEIVADTTVVLTGAESASTSEDFVIVANTTVDFTGAESASTSNSFTVVSEGSIDFTGAESASTSEDFEVTADTTVAFTGASSVSTSEGFDIVVDTTVGFVGAESASTSEPFTITVEGSIDFTGAESVSTSENFSVVADTRVDFTGAVSSSVSAPFHILGDIDYVAFDGYSMTVEPADIYSATVTDDVYGLTVEEDVYTMTLNPTEPI